MRLPDFPAMYGLSEPLGKASEDFAFHIYGQVAPLNRELPAAELMRRLVAEASGIFGSLATSLK